MIIAATVRLMECFSKSIHICCGVNPNYPKNWGTTTNASNYVKVFIQVNFAISDDSLKLLVIDRQCNCRSEFIGVIGSEVYLIFL